MSKDFNILSLLNRYGFIPQFLRAIAVSVMRVAIYRLGLQIQTPFSDAEALQQSELVKGLFNARLCKPVWLSIFPH